jgi:hypothetical protein
MLGAHLWQLYLWVKNSIDSGSHVAHKSIKVGTCAEKWVAFLDIMLSDIFSNIFLSATERAEPVNQRLNRSGTSYECVFDDLNGCSG